MSVKLQVGLRYHAKILDFIHIVQRLLTSLVGRCQTFSVVDGYQFTLSGIEEHLGCARARPFMERVSIGLKEKSVRIIVDWSVQ